MPAAITAFLRQVQALTDSTRQVANDSSILPNRVHDLQKLLDQSFELKVEAERLHNAIQARIKAGVGHLEQKCADGIEKLEDVRMDFVEKGRVRDARRLESNIIRIFHYQGSSTGSDREKRRRVADLERSLRIRKLGHRALLLWAEAFTQVQWGKRAMTDDVFDILIETAEKMELPSRSREIETTLHEVGRREPMASSMEFRDFLKGWCYLCQAIIKLLVKRQQQTILVGGDSSGNASKMRLMG